MICPQCGRPHRLCAQRHNDAAVGICHRCAGFWFSDRRSTPPAPDIAPDPPWLEIDFWSARAEFHIERDALQCPQCRGSFLTKIHDASTNTEVSTCTRCRGIWLDAGRFERIVRMMDREPIR